jgi:glycosyltransferase involved in cell wall biosynthesis
VKNVQAEIRRLSHVRIQNDRVEVLFLGGSEAVRKGLRELLITIPILAHHFPRLVFRLVAASEEFAESLVPKDYRDRYIVEGWISGQAKFERFARADIFVLPTHAEGMPMAILEAMAAALPVVTSNVGGIPDMIRDGKEGLLVPSGDVSALSEAISKLIESKNLRTEMGNRALERVAREYDLSIGIENVKRLYMFLLTGALN